MELTLRFDREKKLLFSWIFYHIYKLASSTTQCSYNAFYKSSTLSSAPFPSMAIAENLFS